MDYGAPHTYTIAAIRVTGTDYLNKEILVTLSGLSVGQELTVPGQDISNAINKLWRQKLFAGIEILADSVNTTSNNIWLNIHVTEKPRIGTFSFVGPKKGDIDDIRKKINIARGQVFNENVKSDVVNQIKNFYQEKGYADTKVKIAETKDSTQANSLKLTFF
jgi:outer membrane protein insertion porin family